MKRYSHPLLSDVTLQDILAALADPCRMQIVSTLLQAGRALACNEVPLEVSKATASHHFEVLRDAGLIETTVEGTKCMTSVRSVELEKHFPGLLNLLLANAGSTVKRSRTRKNSASAR